MNNFKIRLSLRYKLLFLLTALPVVALALYVLMATGLFKTDKVAYVYDSSATVSRSLATQVRIELQGAYASLRSIVEYYDFSQRQFSDVARELFNKSAKTHALLLYKREASGQYVKLGELAKDEPAAKNFVRDEKMLLDLRDQAIHNAAFAIESPTLAGSIAVAFRLGEVSDPDHMVVLALYQTLDMLNAFDEAGNYSSSVITRGGRLSVGGTGLSTDLPGLLSIIKSKIAEGTAEATLPDGQTYLISYSPVGLGDLTVISKVDKKKALKTVDVLIAKSLLFFIVLFASTFLISIFAANSLTSALRELFEATAKIAQGDFKVRVKARSKDEVGGLAESFNWMAAEVSRLMSETAEKARMESELATVRTVQETLFPAAQIQYGPLRIMGHYEPASECGGDWWSYSRVGNKIYLWIGDATGHGAPAALITSAARSAAAVIEGLPDMTPAKALTIMNRAIQMTSKGQIMMTFFMASIDLDAGTFSYASASHDPPYLLRRTGGKLTRKDLVPLNEVNGPRLGEQKEFQYKDITVEFSPGDMVFLYTDGILDIENPEGKKWGERAFLKSLLESANCPEKVDGKVERLLGDLNGFRLGSSLIDDVTMILCEFEVAEKAKVAA